MLSAVNTIENSRIRRVCLLSQKAALRRYKSEVSLHQKLLQRKSKAFTQNVLLYLAESSQLRHQRQARTNKITKMFRVSLDDVEPLHSTKLLRLKGIQGEETKEAKKKPDETERQSVPRSLSNASEISFSSSIEDANRRVSLLQRSRARSIGVIQEVPEIRRRRLSAPEVVITPVTPAPVVSSDSLEESSSTPGSPPPTGDENEILYLKEQSPSTTTLPLEPPQEITGSPNRTSIKSSFRTYSKATVPLLKRMISHESSTSRRRSERADSIPQGEVEQPALDMRFVDLISNLHVYLRPSTEDDILAMSVKKPAN